MCNIRKLCAKKLTCKITLFWLRLEVRLCVFCCFWGRNDLAFVNEIGASKDLPCDGIESAGWATEGEEDHAAD